jgi:hypothetical protein
MCGRRGARARRQQRGLERWRNGEATRGRGGSRGVDGGQKRRIAPAAGAPDVQWRRAEEGRGARKKKGGKN